MLGSLFKQGWQSDSVETRLSSVKKLDPTEASNQLIFHELANGDPDKSVRNIALNKITDVSILFNISQLHESPETKLDAKQAFAKLLGAKGQLSEQQLIELSVAIPESIPSIIQHGQHAQLRSELVSEFSDMELANIISEIEYTDTRALIAGKLDTIEALEIARKGLKGKDKTAEKIVKEKIDIIHAQQKLDQENAENALTLCEKMEYLAQHIDPNDWRAEFKGQYSVWSQRWNEMDYSPDPKIDQRYNRAYEKVSAVVVEMTKVADALSVQNTLCDDLEFNCQQVAKLSLEELNKAQVKLAEKLTTLQSDWDVQASINMPAVPLQKRFERSYTSLKSVIAFSQSVASGDNDNDVLQSALSKLNWQIAGLTLSSQAEAQAALDELVAEVAETKQAERNKLDKLHKRMHRLLGVTKQGNLAQARRELAAISKAIEHFSGKDRSILDERLEKANDVVSKMADWNNFVTEPKYLELCAAMETFVGAKTKPDKLAKQIHALQEQWKGLGYSDSSEIHWERFKTAADKAYEPCAEFFAQRKVIRRENLAKREPFLQQMRELWENTDWDESPDYKAIENGVRGIMQQWQTVKDVEQGPGQKQWKKLNKLKSLINEKMDLVYNANIELKNKLISQTNDLLELDVNDQTLSKLQLFQSRWKQVGITRRKQDQVAWKRFKACSDEVYAKIQGLRKEVRAEEDAQINQYRDINQQIQQLAKTEDNLATGDKQFAQLQSDYDALPELPQNLPEKLIKKLELDNRRACDSYTKTRERIMQAGRSKILETLTEKAQLCAQLEQLETDAPTQKIEQLQQALDAINIEDKALAKQIKQRIAGAAQCDHKKAAQKRKRMCIDLEILLGVDSPNEDKALRMSIQLEKLKNKGLGQGLNLNNETLRQLKVDWLCLPGADKTTQKSLDQRFNNLIKIHYLQ